MWRQQGLCWRLLLLAGLLLSPSAPAATVEQESAWAAWFNTTRFNPTWGLTSDVQFRSSDHWEDLQNVLLRPGITYYADARNNFTVGYAWIGTFNRPSGDVEEHRVWQQWIHTQSLRRAALAHRLRLEQRFVEPAPGQDRRYSQRLRYFLRAVIPLEQSGSAFERGFFAALQNEIFLNVQHRDAVNGSVFDQNRAYLAAGYRLGPRFDLEIGYLNQAVRGQVDDTRNHVLQFALYTRF